MKGVLLIEAPRSLIPACDVEGMGLLYALAKAVAGVEGVGALKLGMEQDIPMRLADAVSLVRDEAGFKGPVIYDRQKAATDIPDLGVKFAKRVAKAKADAAILFPLSGPKTQTDWTETLFGEGIVPIVGGEMTHPNFLASDGGYIADDAPDRIYTLAVEQGVRNFIVPGNKPEKVAHYYELLKGLLGDERFMLAAPGLIAQGGDPTEAGKAAGPRFHGIIGRALTNAADMAAAAQAMAKTLLASV